MKIGCKTGRGLTLGESDLEFPKYELHFQC